ncbi:MAG: sigma-70 family RNA polymerase sigma factor [Chitinophagaceae bacterium]
MNYLPEMPIEVSVASIKQGDQAAFLDVYNSLHKKAFHFFLKKVSLQEDAKDLTQQTFIRLWQYRHTLSEEHTIDKQLFVIAHSILINHLKKEWQRNKVIKMAPAPATDFYEPQLHFELNDQLDAAIDSLPPVRKKILRLKAHHDYSNLEIAQQMNISVKTVEDHVTRGFRHIKQLFPLAIIFVDRFL